MSSTIALVNTKGTEAESFFHALKEYLSLFYTDSGIVITNGGTSFCIYNTAADEKPWKLEVFLFPDGFVELVEGFLSKSLNEEKKITIMDLFNFLSSFYGVGVIEYAFAASPKAVIVITASIKQDNTIPEVFAIITTAGFAI